MRDKEIQLSSDQTPKIHYDFAHVLRGVAALIVMLPAHLLGVFWVSPPTVKLLLGVPDFVSVCPQGPYKIATILDFCSSWLLYGHFGVGLFFLISGFVIPFSLTSLSKRQFLISRFFRIYPTYWVGFSLSLLVLLGLSENSKILTWKHVISSFVLMRDWWLFPSIDGISWTLEVEIKFYVFCALLSTAVVLGKTWKFLLVVVGLTIGVALLPCAFSGPPKLIGAIIKIFHLNYLFIVYMCIGIVLNWHVRSLASTKQSLLMISIILACFFLLWWVNPYYAAEFKLGTFNYVLALLVFSVCYINRHRIHANKFWNWMGNISYPLYVIHAILGYGTLYYMIYVLKISPLLSLLFVVSLIFVLADFMHRFIEKRCTRFGKRLAISLGDSPEAPLDYKKAG